MMLTTEQEAIVYSNQSHLKVLSAAGSGKTTVLVGRIAQLHQNGADPSSMLVITFTRRAGKELAHRLPPSCHTATIGTFHSTILRVMQANGRNPNVLTEEEADALVDACAKSLGVMVGGKYKKHSRKYYKKEISKARNGGPATPMSQMYQSQLAINGDIDFDGILLEGVRMVAKGEFNWVKYLLVDEAQDNEPLQWAFVNAIAKFANVMVVGDIGQSLYSFRGAVPEQFAAQGWPSLEMQESFRFPCNIGDISNRIGATPLKVFSKKPAAPVMIHKNRPIQELLRHILQFRDPSDVAVLCRYNDQVEQVRADLASAGISVVVPSIQWRGPLHDLLIYLGSTGSRTARERLISSWRDVRPKIVQYIASGLSQQAASAMAQEWISSTNGSVVSVINNIEMPSSMIPEATWILREYGHLDLAQYKAETSEQEWIADGKGVSVGTVHWSKGGQWPEVIIPFLDQHKFPRHKETPEELRVLYVAITRVMDQLHLMHGDNPSEFLRFFA